MPRYQYTALNQQNKKLSGIIDAVTETSARNELNLIGLSILGLEEMSGTPETPSNKKNSTLLQWKFEALDLGGKKIIGSIRSQDTFLAYQRLCDEYSFKVLALYPPNATENEMRLARTTEIRTLENCYLENKKKQQKPKKNNEISREQKREKLLREVDEIIQAIQKRLAIHQEDIQPDSLSAIKKEINKLLRLKTSSNLEYIEQICGDILKIFRSPQTFKNPKNTTPERIKTAIHIKLLEKKLLRYDKKKSSWRESLRTYTETQPAQSKIITLVLEKISKLFYERPEMQTIKTKLSDNRTAIADHIKIWLSATKEEKTYILPIIKNLWIERMEIKNDLAKEKYIEKTTVSPYIMELHAPNILSALLEESVIFTGWLLAFYLMYYFIAIYTRTKDFGSEFLSEWYLFDSPSFRYAFTILFMLHITFNIKKTFFMKNATFSFFMVPLLLGTTILLIYNL